MTDKVDLGSDHSYSWVRWAPDRDLNPQYADMPDDPHYGIQVFHKNKAGEECPGFVTFSKLAPPPVWELISVEPLTMSPSLLCRTCGDHGFIRDGKWVAA